MASTIQLKRSALSGKVPDTGSLNLGELAVNTFDGKIFFKKSGSVESIQSVVTTNSITTGSIELVGNQTITGSVQISGSQIINGSQIITGSLIVRVGTGETRFGNTNGRTLSAYDNGALSNFDFIANQTYFNSDFLIADGKKISTANGVLGDLYLTTNTSSAGIRTDRNLTVTGSLRVSGSQIITGSLGVSGDVTVLGAINARQFNIGIISSSILYQSGSNKFGDTQDDTHQFTGSVSITGSLLLNGVAVSTGSSGGASGAGVFDFNLDPSTGTIGYITDSGSNYIIQATSTSVNILGGITPFVTITSQSFSTNTTLTASLQQGYTLVGNSSGVTYAVATSSFGGALPNGVISGSTQITNLGYATTGSNFFNGNQTVTGSLTIANATTPATKQILAVDTNGYLSFGNVVYSGTIGSSNGYVNLTQNFPIIGNVSTSGYMFSSGTNATAGTQDVGIRRNASGTVEIFNGLTGDGTLTNRRDLLLRNITGSNAFFSGSSTITGSLNVTGSLYSNGSLVAQQDNALYHNTIWFTPTSLINVTGSIVNISSGQFTSVMATNYSKLTINGESKFITSFSSSNSVVVDSNYSQNYTNVTSGSWGVYSKSLTFLSVDNTTRAGGFRILSNTGTQNLGAVYDRIETNLKISDGQNNASFTPASTATFQLGGDKTIIWYPYDSGNAINGTTDLGLRRNNTGSLEIYNGANADGAIANRRDLILRNITGSNAFFSGSSTFTGSLGVSGSITANTFIGSIGATNGVVSGSSQIDVTATTNWITGIKTRLDANTVISGSSQIDVLSTTNIARLATTGSNTFVGNQTFSGSLIPAVSGAYDLGTLTNPWRHLYVGSGSIFLVDNKQTVTKTISANTLVTTTDIASGTISLTASLPAGIISSSAQLTSSYDTRYVLSGSITQTTWDNIASKPGGIVSGSSQITYANISSIPSGIVSGSSQTIANLPTGVISGSSQLNNASIENLTVINLTTVNETASVIFSSGSNRFGDFSNDTHSFTGSVQISGSTTITGSVNVTGSLLVNGVAVLATTSSRAEQNFTATAAQTTFTVTGGYTVGLVDVYVNGNRYLPTDYTATNGTTVVLGTGLLVNDTVTILNYTSTIVALPTSRNVQDFTATAAQTTFTVTNGYIVGLLDVFVNGSKLSSSEFTATNGTTFVLTIASTVGDQVQSINYTASINGISGAGTANELAYFTASGTIASLPTATYPSLTELSYVKGVTSAIQTQLNAKAATLSGTTNYIAKFTSSTAIGNSVIYDNGTNASIGNTNPFAGVTTLTGMAISDRGGIYKLTVNDTIYVSNNLYYDGSNYKRITANGGTFVQLESVDGGSFAIQSTTTGTAGSTATLTERMRINSTGTIVLPSNQSTPSLNAFGLILQGYAVNNSWVSDNLYYSNGSGWLRSVTGSVTQIYFNGGKIETYTAGSDSAGSVVTRIAGPYLTNGGTSWTNSSDIRKKKNFEPTQGLAEVLQIETIKYNLITEDDKAIKRLGFKAQNLQTLIPEMVMDTSEKAPDGSYYLGLTQDYILPVLVKAIQELSAENTSLINRIEALENK